jgi:chloride channel protein, CIC family
MRTVERFSLATLGAAPAAVRRRLSKGRAAEGAMLPLAVTTGILTGVLAWVLISIVEVVQHVLWIDPAPAWQRLLIPMLGGLLVGIWVERVVPEARGGGVVTTMETIALRGGRFRGRVPVAGAVATGAALGTGASGGREGPIVLIGGAIGSLLARVLPPDEDRSRLLVAGGAAAGIGASFNAPIGGMLFAIELLLGGIRRAGSLQVVVVASVAGSVTARQLVGEDLPLFRPRPGLELGSPAELLLYAGLGIAAVAVALLLRRSEDLARRWFRRVRSWPAGLLLAPTLGGAAVGAIAIVVPEILSDGADLPPIDGAQQPIQAMLDVEFGLGWAAVGFVLLLLVAKLVATVLAVESGAPVGTFAPMLFLGAALGNALGVTAVEFLGPGSVDPGAFALVGMAAVFAAAARAPLTAILIVFELTGSYALVLPLMVAVGLATFVAELRGTDSIYHHQLRERGVVYGQTDDLDVLQTVTVAEVMTEHHPTVPEGLPRAEVERRFTVSGSHGFAVTDDRGRLVGVISVRDLQREGATAGELCTRRTLTVTPDDPVFRAVRRMASLDVGRIPVVDPQTRRVLGMIRRADVVTAYQRGINRSTGVQQRQATGRLRDLTGVRFVELVIEEDAAIAGCLVRDVTWPERTVLTSIRRGGEVIVPKGTTVLEAGDELVALTGHADEVRRLLSAAGAAG